MGRRCSGSKVVGGRRSFRPCEIQEEDVMSVIGVGAPVDGAIVRTRKYGYLAAILIAFVIAA
jgi:hypothetical protein